VVAEDVLERLVPRIADAAMDLHRAVRRFADQPVRPVIAHRDLVGEFALDLAVLHPVHLPRGLADQQAQHLALGGKLHQRELDGLVAGEILAERLAFARVADRFLDAERGRAQ
jgi:hypothetical protein